MHGKSKFLKEIIEFLLVYQVLVCQPSVRENTKGPKEKSEKDTEIFRGDFSFSNFQTDDN